MDSISNIFKERIVLEKLTASKKTSERAELIKQFHESINAERKGTKWKPLSAGYIAVRLAGIPTADLYFLLKSCEQGDSFGKVFFGSIKAR